MKRLATLLCLTGLLGSGGCFFLIGATVGVDNTVRRATAKYETRRFRVMDAESGLPVGGADVTASHHFDIAGDWTSTDMTNGHGFASVRVAKDYLFALGVEVSAGGYLRRRVSFGPDRPPGVSPLSEDPVCVYVYRGPRAQAGLLLPDGFRGNFVFATGPARHEFPFPPDFPAGKRMWWTEVRPGEVAVVAPAPPLGPTDEAEPLLRIATRGGEEFIVPEIRSAWTGVAAWGIAARDNPERVTGSDLLQHVGDRTSAVAAAAQAAAEGWRLTPEWERAAGLKPPLRGERRGR